MTLTTGEIMTLVGMAAGFAAMTWRMALVAGRLSEKMDSTNSSLASHKNDTATFQREMREHVAAMRGELEEKVTAVDAKVQSVGSTVAALGGYLAAKFSKSSPNLVSLPGDRK